MAAWKTVTVPEGDTIFRSARTLNAALRGQVVTSVSTTVPQLRRAGVNRLVGQSVTDVEPRGKHLLHHFGPSGAVLHTHMRMSGSWHLYRPGERWRRPMWQATVVLDTAAWSAIGFSVPVCELLTAAEAAVHPDLLSLGPDALGARVDLDEVERRLAANPDRPIGEALLDQRVLAGVGNVYKNEVLFLHAVDPWARVGDLDPAVRAALVASSVQLLRANVAPGSPSRVTTSADARAGRPGANNRPGRDGDRLAVYGKRGRPCPRCGTAITSAPQGTLQRRTWWCPTCQGPGPVM